MQDGEDRALERIGRGDGGADEALDTIAPAMNRDDDHLGVECTELLDTYQPELALVAHDLVERIERGRRGDPDLDRGARLAGGLSGVHPTMPGEPNPDTRGSGLPRKPFDLFETDP